MVRDDTLPSGLDLRKDGARVEKATIKVGESFAVTDGHHVGHGFKLIAIEDGAAKLQTTFWTSFPGREPTESKSTALVRSYVTRRKKEVGLSTGSAADVERVMKRIRATTALCRNCQ